MKKIEKDIQITFDETVDAGYISLQNITAGGVEYTFPVIIEQNGCMFNIDMDKNKRIIGFELIGMEGSVSQEIMDAFKNTGNE